MQEHTVTWKLFFGRKCYTEYINSPILSVREHARRAAINTRIQRTAADIIRLAMIELSDELKKKSKADEIKIINTVHDELIVEVKEERVEEIKKTYERSNGRSGRTFYTT